MNQSFQHYARYYDLLYREKDYKEESSFVHGIVQRYVPDAASLFELGCDTGRHALEFARIGYRVEGIDLSESMIKRSRELYAAQAPPFAGRLTAKVGDVRHHREARTFDAVLSLFHVVNYQTTNTDLEATMVTAASLTRPGGVFLFDFWYGPAVLTDKPSVRVRRLEDDVLSILRLSEPEMRTNENRVDVNYHIIARDKEAGKVCEVHERHSMRYLFLPEINNLLEGAGFEPIATGAWLRTDKPLGTDTWYGWLVARKL